MEDLTKVEETVLIAIWQLDDRAYGYNVRKHIRNVFKKEFTIGNLYSVLNQLDRKGYVSKSSGESSEQKRGKPKIYYSITDNGFQALRESRKAYSLVWSKVPRGAFNPQE